MAQFPTVVDNVACRTIARPTKRWNCSVWRLSISHFPVLDHAAPHVQPKNAASECFFFNIGEAIGFVHRSNGCRTTPRTNPGGTCGELFSRNGLESSVVE